MIFEINVCLVGDVFNLLLAVSVNVRDFRAGLCGELFPFLEGLI